MNGNADLLCLRCRSIGHTAINCKARGVGAAALPLPPRNSEARLDARRREGALLAPFQASSAPVCDKCRERIAIPEMFTQSVPRPSSSSLSPSFVSSSGDKTHPSSSFLYVDARGTTPDKTQRSFLGPLREITLHASCPLCRLIFWVFPDTGDREDSDVYYLRPFKSCNRIGNFALKNLGAFQEEYATYICVDSEQNMRSNIARLMGEPSAQVINAVSYAFSLTEKNPAKGRAALSARRLGPTVDYARLRSWLAVCISQHETISDDCGTPWSDELLTCTMIDVRSRSLVSCPMDCKYVALSYVWGGIGPKAGDLERGTLPQTIEDAITVTKGLELDYLWIDALCIDQSPTPQQAQQLAMMDVIYQCAAVTIVAMSSETSDSGIPGVSQKNPRLRHWSEVVDGKELAVIPPLIEQELENATYMTRAWTLQELSLSRRWLYFTKDQVVFACGTCRFYEAVDESLDPANCLGSWDNTKTDEINLDFKVASKAAPEARLLSVAEERYRAIVNIYTSRHLSFDRDAVNAILGILRSFKKTYPLREFYWGLPIADFPQSLRWYHARGVKPRRRPTFPSWSWAGWEGQVMWSEAFVLEADPKKEWMEKSVVEVAKFAGIQGQVLAIDASVVTLEVRNEPFGDAYVPGTDYLLGSITEGNFMKISDLLPSGIHDFLVVERRRYRPAPGRPHKEDVYLLLLEWDGMEAYRKAKMHLFVSGGVDFARAEPKLKRVHLK